ncbi:S8 family serine peptidase [Pontiellaceae bacterium B12227]|nr:S8 family serine peptidase [Pontiellaceae bacterium B12227]
MKIITYSLIGAVVLGAITSHAKKPARFEEFPDERQKFVEAARERSAKDLKKAEAWAKARGMKTRFKRDGVLHQLVAVENDQPRYLVTYNATASSISKATQVRTAPYNLDGAGVTVGVWDAGSILTTHQEFGGRVTYAVNQSEPVDDHATHVGGTVAASGVQSSAKGMAPAATVISYDWSDDLAEMGEAAATAPGQAGKLYLSNHSYGYGTGIEYGNTDDFGQYSYYSREADLLVDGNRYYLPFWAAGNDRDEDGSYKSGYPNGYDTMADYAIAKNIMTVGAISDSKAMSGFSSWGPADDGRIKPDIVANGVTVYSTLNSANNAYIFYNGTSMASPSACGSAALLVEYYKELFSGGAMWASTLKGLIIHTADDLGNAGPDYSYGWGVMNTKAAADLLKDYASPNPIRLTEAELSAANSSDDYIISLAGNEAFRVTLCWTDPAGSVNSADDDRVADLVNDLDLKVVGPGGTHYPYKLSYTSPSALATTTGENNVDNVEQVYIEAPAIGQYTITVNYDGTLDGGAQEYSLFISGIASDADDDDIPDYWESQYFLSPTGAVADADPDKDGADNLTEYITGYDPTDKNSVFAMSSYELPAVSGDPVIINWPTKAGRVYSVSSTYNIQYVDFVPFPDATDLPYTQNSYTDTVNHAQSGRFYRIDVKLGE